MFSIVGLLMIIICDVLFITRSWLLGGGTKLKSCKKTSQYRCCNTIVLWTS